MTQISKARLRFIATVDPLKQKLDSALTFKILSWLFVIIAIHSYRGLIISFFKISGN
jgi:hypothetical protein